MITRKNTFAVSWGGGVVGSDLSSLLPSGLWRRRSSAACSARATEKEHVFGS